MSSTIKQAILALKSRIADAYTAISNKGGTLPATQDSANLATAIASIPSGSEIKEEKDINFIDHTGIIVESYTFAEAALLEQLPSAKEYNGLTFVSWQFTLQEVLFYVGKHCPLNIGAYYNPTDNLTHIFITIPNDNFTFAFTPYGIAYNGAEYIDWGDGNTTTAARSEVTHIYATAGKYEIKISSDLTKDNGKYTINSFSVSAAMCVRKIYLSTVCTSFNAAGCLEVEEIVCNGVDTFAAPTQTTSLKVIIEPSISGNFGSRMCRYMCAHHTNSATYGIEYAYNLRLIPPLGEGQTTISQDYYRRLWNVKTIYIPSSVTTIGNTPFEDNYRLQDIYWYCSAVPTLPSASYIGGYMRSKYVVNMHILASLQSAYEADTNWAALMANSSFNFIADL